MIYLWLKWGFYYKCVQYITFDCCFVYFSSGDPVCMSQISRISWSNDRSVWSTWHHYLYLVTLPCLALDQQQQKFANELIIWFSDSQQGIFYMHYPTDRKVHTMVFVTPVVNHLLEYDIDQWVYTRGKETNILFNDTLNIFYLRLNGVRTYDWWTSMMIRHTLRGWSTTELRPTPSKSFRFIFPVLFQWINNNCFILFLLLFKLWIFLATKLIRVMLTL